MQVERLTIDGVFVSVPSPLDDGRGGTVMSGIRKREVDDPCLPLTETNLSGDGQADLTAHGGVDKAVYVYPVEHHHPWRADGFAIESGGMGENVSTSGMTEQQARVGDIFSWGEALVQITQPRAPCFKLSLHTGRKDIGPTMIRTGRTGWYLRVLRPGSVPTTGLMELVERGPREPTVAETFTVMFSSEPDPRTLGRVLASAALAPQWHDSLVARHGPVLA